MSSAAPSSSPPNVVWVVLEQCSLETVKTKRGFELLNCDDHQGACKRAGRNPADYRPDIVHQVLLALLDSPLNKAGGLRVLMQTKKNILIDVLPQTRIPRTFKRFCGLMGAFSHFTTRTGEVNCAQPSRLPIPLPLARPSAVVQLLHNLRVRAADSNETLLKVIKNPVTDHLPTGCTVVGLEVDAECVDPFDLPARLLGGSAAGGNAAAGAAPKGKKRAREAEAIAAAPASAAPPTQLAFVIGAMSHGNINPNYITQTVSLSRYPLSAACTVSKLTCAFEHHWGIL